MKKMPDESSSYAVLTLHAGFVLNEVRLRVARAARKLHPKMGEKETAELLHEFVEISRYCGQCQLGMRCERN